MQLGDQLTMFKNNEESLCEIRLYESFIIWYESDNICNMPEYRLKNDKYYIEGYEYICNVHVPNRNKLKVIEEARNSLANKYECSVNNLFTVIKNARDHKLDS